MTDALDMWNELLAVVARPVRTEPGVERTLDEILEAIGADAGPEETRDRVLKFLAANRTRLTSEQMDELIVFGMCASNAVRAMVPHIGTAAAWARGLKHDKIKGGEGRTGPIEKTKAWVLTEYERRGLTGVATNAARLLGPEAIEQSKIDGWRMEKSAGKKPDGTQQFPYPTVLEWIRDFQKCKRKK